MSVSIVVIDTDASFKPEYIIPQLIIEYIITNNRNEYKEGKRDLLVLYWEYTIRLLT